LACLLFSILALPANSVALGAAAPNAPKAGDKALYNVVFGRDDKTCITLRDFYNRHLHDYDSERTGLLENRFGRELQGKGIEFLSETTDWRHTEKDLDWREFLANVDIYNNGSSRTVITQESTYSASLPRSTFDTQSSTIAIFKSGVDVNKARRSLDEAGFSTPEIEQRIDFGQGGSSLGPSNSFYIIQEVAPTPSLDGRPPLRAGIGSTYQRLVRSQGRIYGVARYQSLAIGPRMDDVIRPNAPITRGYLLVYSPTPLGAINDVCVLEIAYTLSRR
jgi:hypothetical protein